MENAPLSCTDCPRMLGCADELNRLHDERATVIEKALTNVDARVEIEKFVQHAQAEALLHEDSDNEFVREATRHDLALGDLTLRSTEHLSRGYELLLKAVDSAEEQSYQEIEDLSAACKGLQRCLRKDPRQTGLFGLFMGLGTIFRNRKG